MFNFSLKSFDMLRRLRRLDVENYNIQKTNSWKTFIFIGIPIIALTNFLVFVHPIINLYQPIKHIPDIFIFGSFAFSYVWLLPVSPINYFLSCYLFKSYKQSQQNLKTLEYDILVFFKDPPAQCEFIASLERLALKDSSLYPYIDSFKVAFIISDNVLLLKYFYDFLNNYYQHFYDETISDTQKKEALIEAFDNLKNKTDFAIETGYEQKNEQEIEI